MPLLAEFKLLKKEVSSLTDKLKSIEQFVEQFSTEALKEAIEGGITKVKEAVGQEVLLAYKDGLKDGAELSSGKRFEPSRGRMQPPNSAWRSGSRGSYDRSNERSDASTPSDFSSRRSNRDDHHYDYDDDER